MNSSSENNLTTSTNLALNEINSINKKIDTIIDIDDTLKLDILKKKLSTIRDVILVKESNTLLAQLLLSKVEETRKKLNKKMNDIKDDNKPLFDTLYEILLSNLSVLSEMLIYFSPTIIVFVVVLYILYSTSEYATLIRDSFQKLFKGPE